jgi:formimidoylglutamate deiminase
VTPAPMPTRDPTAPADLRGRRLWAPLAWTDRGGAGFASGVLLAVDAGGRWASVDTGVAAPPADAHRVEGVLLPGLVDAHSHAFQRAFVGLAERRASPAHDDFWSWRERMYAVAGRLGPDDLRAVATRLYAELLAGGYTHVVEFHYLAHAPGGAPYADPLAMAWALADAAEAVGIGLTVCPVLYERGGFDGRPLSEGQRRFALDADAVRAAAARIDGLGRPRLRAGLAVHSLRAASPGSIDRLVALAEGFDGPIHVHVAEQTQEVEDCVRATGRRPIAQLAATVPLDRRWQLVHATHAEPAEIEAVARSGAGVVFCPTTEANLGDGLPDLPRWLAAGVPWTVGSDSQVGRDWREELRWLELGQRLVHRRRALAADPPHRASTGERLVAGALAGSAAAAGTGAWGLVPGAPADALVVGPDALRSLGVEAEALLDALVFSSPAAPFRGSLVGGRFADDGGSPAEPR